MAKKYNHKKIAQEIREMITDKRVKTISNYDIQKYTGLKIPFESFDSCLIEIWFNKLSGSTSDSWLKNFSYWYDDNNIRKAFIEVYKINIGKYTE